MGSRRRLWKLLLAKGLLLPGLLVVPLGGVELAGVRVDCERVPVEAAATSTPPPHRCGPPLPRRRDDDDRRTANLRITGHNDLSVARPGQTVSYTLRVRNTGPDGVASAVVRDEPPATLERVRWTCTVIRGGGCDQQAGLGRLRTTVDLRAGGAIIFTLTGLVSRQAPLGRRQLYNVAAVLVPRHVHDPNRRNNLAVDIDDLVAAPVVTQTTLVPPPVTSPPLMVVTTAPPPTRPAPAAPPTTASPTTMPAPVSPPTTVLRYTAPEHPKRKPHHGLLVVAGVAGMLLMTVVATARPSLPSARRQKS